MVVPFTDTETPGMGESSSEETTFPVTDLIWAFTPHIPAKKSMEKINNTFFIEIDLN